MRTISRQELFEDVWTRPLTKIAPELGISDVALRKICSRHNIPAPLRGYWAQVASGKTFQRPSLPPAKGPAYETIQIVGVRKPAPEVIAVMERVRAERQANPTPELSANETSVQKQPGVVVLTDGRHRWVRATYEKLAKAGAKDDDIVHLKGKGLFTVAVTPSQAERIGALLTQLVLAVEAKGWVVDEGGEGLRLVPDGEPIGFEVVEQTERVRHQPTEAEQQALRKYEEAHERKLRRGEWVSSYDRPKVPEWDDNPTGQLTLTLADGRRIDGMRRKFSDGKTQRLEQLIEPILQSLEIFAASEKAWRDQAERQRIQAIEDEKRRKERQRRIQLEEKRLEFLKHQMDRHQRALEVEAFVADVEAGGPTTASVIAFLNWAKGYAALLREDIAPDSLQAKLERHDLMNDELEIGSWVDVDIRLEPRPDHGERHYASVQRQGAPWWFWKRR